MIQCYIKICSDLDEKVNRRNILPTLKTAEVAVADIQADGQLFLRYAIDLAQVLDTFADGVRIKVHKSALRPCGSAATGHTTRSERGNTVGGEP